MRIISRILRSFMGGRRPARTTGGYGGYRTRRTGTAGTGGLGSLLRRVLR